MKPARGQPIIESIVAKSVLLGAIRDVLLSVGAGEDPDTELVADHLTSNLTFASPEWSLEHAAAAMVRGGFRHLVVVEGGELAGILSMRDIVRCWTGEGASCEVPAAASG